MESVRISKGRVIPVVFCLVGTFLLFLIYKFLFDYTNEFMFVAIGMVISPLLPLMWTSRKIVEINPNKKYIHKFIWLMGKKTGKPEAFNGIDKIFVNKVRASQRMTSWGGSVHNSRFMEFIGILKFDNGEKIELIRDKDLDFVFEKLEKISQKLGTKLYDNTKTR